MSEECTPSGWVSPARHRSPRVTDDDYALSGTHFVTVCATAGQYLFGEVVNRTVWLTEIGRIVEGCWRDIPRHFQAVELDLHVVMRNHLHGLVTLTDGAESSDMTKRPTIHTVVGAFKSAAARRVNVVRRMSGARLWERAYYEHVVRSDDGLERIRQYFADNPAK